MKMQNHRASGRHIGSIYPFGHDLPLLDYGTYIGDNIFGNPFLFDPFELYRKQLITNPNMVILGQIGRGKSAFIKSFVARQIAFGRTAWIIDPKGEYQSLCKAFGVTPITLKKNGPIRINPISEESLFKKEGQSWRGSDSGIVVAIIEARLKRELSPLEMTVIQLVIRYAKDNEPNKFSIDRLAKLFINFQPAMAYELSADFELLYEKSRQMAYCFNLVVNSELFGLFSTDRSKRNTDIQAFTQTPIVVIDLSEFFNSTSLDIVMACTISWMQSFIANKKVNNKWYFVIDEAWAVLNNFATRNWLQRLWKLSRAYGLSNIAVFHRLSDLSHVNFSGDNFESGFSDSSQGLISDSETKIIFSQPQSELELLKQTLKLNSTELEILPKLTRAHALWKVSEKSFLIRHRISEFEKDIVDTDQQLKSDISFNSPSYLKAMN